MRPALLFCPGAASCAAGGRSVVCYGEQVPAVALPCACRLGRRWRLKEMELVGHEPLPGLTYQGRPVLPSDHFGLLLELEAVE